MYGIWRVERLARLIRKIKSAYPLEVCVSAGLLDGEKSAILKDAGLDRLNHNLNTSAGHYNSICTTHTYEDRWKTLQSARQAGLQLCSGVIVGMQESYDDILEVAYSLRELKVESIPVNFFMPIPGSQLPAADQLTPDFCLRVLCLYRFINPRAEIRMAAGREMHLRSMQVLGLYAADSLFLDGYLNTRGDESRQTLRMIKDAGFEIASKIPVDQLLGDEGSNTLQHDVQKMDQSLLKDVNDLRPHMQSNP